MMLSKKSKGSNLLSITNIFFWLAFCTILCITIFIRPYELSTMLWALAAIVINPLWQIFFKGKCSVKRKYIFQGMQVVLCVVLTLFGVVLRQFGKNESNQAGLSESEILKVSFLDVGQADCILVQQNDENMLIDAGAGKTKDALVSYLRSQGVVKFKYIVGTHPHEDHIGGMSLVIDSFDVENILMPFASNTTKSFENVLDSVLRKKAFYSSMLSSASNKNLSITVPKIGDEFKLGNALAKVISIGEDPQDLNADSIVLKVSFGDKSFLFTGDATANTEQRMLDQDIRSDVLKIGHHGSAGSTSDSFLAKVCPSMAVISVGKGNTYGHPTEQVISKLRNRNITIYRTDEMRSIIMKCDGKIITVEFQDTKINPNISAGAVDAQTTKPQQSTTYNQDIKDRIVYIVLNGKKYHKDSCRTIKKSKNKECLSISDARDRGYTPCAVCKPDAA